VIIDNFHDLRMICAYKSPMKQRNPSRFSPSEDGNNPSFSPVIAGV
jgi:hypothetical protein